MRTNRFEVFSASITQLTKSVQYLKSRKMAEYGLKGTNALCLCQILDSENGLTATELSRQVEIDKAQVSRCVTELSEKGYIFRDDQNGRRYKQKYRLTEEGRKVAEDVDATARRIQAAVSDHVTEEELDVFYRTLYRICENFGELLQEQA